MSIQTNSMNGIALTRMMHALTSSCKAKFEDLNKSASACSFSQIAARMEPSAALPTSSRVTTCQPTRQATIIIIGKTMQSARFALKRCWHQGANLVCLTAVITFSAWSVFDRGVQPTISARPSITSARAPSAVRPATLSFHLTIMQEEATRSTSVRSTRQHLGKYLAACLTKAKASAHSRIAASMLTMINKGTTLNTAMLTINLSILKVSGLMITSQH